MKKQAVVGLGGLVLGFIFLWVSLRNVEVAAMRDALRSIRIQFVVAACVLYWLALAFRVARWHVLLNQLAPIRVEPVAETLVVGYAVNNLLPARLGELFRADYAKRRFGLTRACVMGAIVIERMLDLVAILGCFSFGILLVTLGANGSDAIELRSMLAWATLVIGGMLGGLTYARSHKFWAGRMPARLVRVLVDLQRGLRALNRTTVSSALLFSLVIWTAEISALSAMMNALDVSLSIAQSMLVMSLASLSTLVPTAPAYLGTYQLVFSTALPMFGYAASLGVVGSGLIQLFLFGSVTLVGIVLLVARSVHTMRPERKESPVSGKRIQSPRI